MKELTRDDSIKKAVPSLIDDELSSPKDYDHNTLTSGREIIDNDFQAIFVHSLDGKLLEINETACKRLGYKREELLNKEREELMALALVGSMPEYTELVERDRKLAYESVSVTDSGEIIPVEVNAKLITFQGEAAILTISRDLTEQRAKENAILNKLEALHKHAITLSRLYSLESVAEYSLDVIEELIGRGKIAIGLINEESLVFQYSRHYPIDKPLKLPLTGAGITIRAVNSGETQLVDDTSKDPDYLCPNESPDYSSELDVPVKINGKVVALINLVASDKNTYTEEDRKIVEIFSEHISSAMIRIELVKNAKISQEP